MSSTNGHTAGGSLRALRDANAGRLLALLADHGRPLSQSELARRTGLSPATVSAAVRRLADADAVVLTAGVSNGRRATLVAARPGPLVGGIDVGRTHVRALVGTGAGPVGEASAALPSGHGPTDALPVVRACLAEAAADAGAAPEDVTAVCVGLPGPIDAARGCVTGGTILPAWVGVEAGDLLSGELGVPVVLDNDANLGVRAAAAEHDVGDGTVIYVKVGSGIGAGVLVDGRPLRGASGLAGEIGHMSAVDGGAVCRCGRRGCLETLASAECVRTSLESILDRPVDLDLVVALAGEGDPVVLRVLEGAGEAIGRCLADICALIDPGMVVVGGPLARAGEALLAPIRGSFRRQALPAVARATDVVASGLGDRAEALGALELARRTAPMRAPDRHLNGAV